MKKIEILPHHIQFVDISDSISLFFHIESLQIYPLQKDSDIFEFLSRLKQQGYKKTQLLYSSADFNTLYNFLVDTICNSPKTLVVEKKNENVEQYTTIVLPIAAKCNLTCPYCFARTDDGFHFGNFTNSDIDKVMEFLVNKQPQSFEKLTIVFFGGEPLLNLEVIKYTIHLFKVVYPQIKVSYSITTNGSILNKEIMKLFRENNFIVLASVDGPENEFNLRNFKNGKNSLKVVLHNLKKLQINNIPLQIRATLSSNNPYIGQTFDFLENLKIPFTVVFAYSSENKEHTHATYDLNILHFIKKQLDDLLVYYINKVQQRLPIYNKHLLDYSSSFRFRIKMKRACSAGIDYFTITANGDIYSCAHLMNNPKYRIGNISEGIFDKSKYIPVDVDDIEECEKCWIKYLCKGSCFAQKISVGKTNRQAKLPNECQLEKMLWEFYIKLYYHIMQIAPEYLKKEENT
jgi:uncharacterized protein